MSFIRSSIFYAVWIIAIGVIVFIVIWNLLKLTEPAYCTWSTQPSVNSSVSVNNDALVIKGGIDGGLVNAVSSILDQSADSIKRIQITSYGGVTNSADDLVFAVARLGAVPIEVPLTCQSACIDFLAKTRGPKIIAPSALLMFHSGARSSGPKRHDLRCFGSTISDFFANLDSGTRHEMLPWAAALNDKLPGLFSLCPTHPLDTQSGMFLTGQEYNDLREGRIKAESLIVKCPQAHT